MTNATKTILRGFFKGIVFSMIVALASSNIASPIKVLAIGISLIWALIFLTNFIEIPRFN